jgi:putative glutamine amidotransferase
MWMLPGYLDGIRQAGALPIVFPFSEDAREIGQLADLCDGFLFTGGHDVSPDVYHETPLPHVTDSCKKRDVMEKIVLEIALKTDKPLLGICRGIQFINAALGGTLYQDIPSQHPSGTEHHQHAPYNIPVHEVSVVKGTPLHTCLDADRLPVNSYHHQAVKTLAPGLEAMAFAPDGLTEAVYMPGMKFLWAVQWHPEFSFRTDENSRKIFHAFVASMESFA